MHLSMPIGSTLKRVDDVQVLHADVMPSVDADFGGDRAETVAVRFFSGMDGRTDGRLAHYHIDFA